MNTAAHIYHQAPTARCALRTMMIVGRQPDERVLDTVADAAGYDVIVVEPPATAYSRIKRETPSLVILCLDFGDLEGFRVMSMLKLDRETSQIPVLTCLLEPMPAHSDV
jgi:PleD family two-component response regulator